MRSVSQDVPIGSTEISLAQLNERSREIFRQIVDSYLTTGEPVGSRNLSRIISMTLSPASVRNVMQDLEQLGLVYAPHASAGRLPTELGLRFFVDALMQIGDLSNNDRVAIEGQVAAAGTTVENVLTEASGLLSGLARAAGAELDQLTQKIIEAGLASWSGGERDERKLIVRGHANLLEDLKAVEDLERVRLLFDELET